MKEKKKNEIWSTVLFKYNEAQSLMSLFMLIIIIFMQTSPPEGIHEMTWTKSRIVTTFRGGKSFNECKLTVKFEATWQLLMDLLAN